MPSSEPEVRRTGRKPVPGRSNRPIAVRLREPVDAVVRARAEKVGMPYGEYVSYLAAHALGMAEYAPELPVVDDPQGELFGTPLTA